MNPLYLLAMALGVLFVIKLCAVLSRKTLPTDPCRPALPAPDIEFVQLAAEFSERFKALSKYYNYFSDNRKYQIKYCYSSLRELGMQTPSLRVEAHSGIIEIDTRFAEKEYVAENYMFYSLIWAWFIRRANGDCAWADQCALAYYQSTGRSMPDLLKGLTKLYLEYGNKEFNKKRLERLQKEVV